MVRLLALVLGAGMIGSAAGAADCRSIVDATARLACFDREAKEDGGNESTATTRDTLATVAPGDFKPTDPDDVYMAPRKYMEKPILLRRMQCFHADKDEYRCISPGSSAFVVFSLDVKNAAAKAEIEDRCGTVRNMLTAACRKTIRLIPRKSDDDTVNGRNRVIVMTEAIEVVEEPAAPARRRR